MTNRVFNLIASLIIVLLNLHYVKVDGQGVISLVNFGILILATTSQLIGGGALIYLLPKYPQHNYTLPAICWIIVSSMLTGGILIITHSPYITITLTLGALQALFIFEQMILLGKGEIAKYQILLFIQASSSLVAIVIFYLVTDWGVLAFLVAQLCSFCITAITGTVFTRTYLSKIDWNISKESIKKLLGFGGYAQLGNLFHLGNQRSYLYFLKNLGAEGNLLAGAFSLLLYIAESFWSVIKSLSAILASKTAQTDEHLEHHQLTKRYVSLGVFAAVIGCVAFYFLPNYLLASYIDYPLLTFKKAFAWLIPGIIANVFTVGYAHLFTGKGLYKNNFYSAGIGLITAVIASFILIPTYKLIGAAFSASLAFTIQSVVQFVLYRAWKKTVKI